MSDRPDAKQRSEQPNQEPPASLVCSLSRAKSVWRNHLKTLAAGEASDLTLGLSATFTLDSLVPHLGAALVDYGYKPKIVLGQFNQMFQTCFDRRAQFSGGDPDVIGFIWRIEDLLALEFAEFLTGKAGALDRAMAKLDQFGAALSHLRGEFGGMIVVSLPPYPQGTAADLLDVDNPVNVGVFHRKILDYSLTRFAEAGEIRFLDLDGLQRRAGSDNCWDARKWYLYKQPYAEAFLSDLGQLLARLVKASRQAPRKCLVLDADNTLWGGIIGEDGIDNISIGEDFPGSAYRDLQNYALYLRSRGVLLAIASKNNPQDVQEVFERHDGMALRADHISAWRVNWDAKSENLRQIASELNIGTDSLVFVDDNPFEIEQVQSALPEVACILLPAEPADILNRLKSYKFFDKFEITEEDAQRADMLKAERMRNNPQAAASPEEFVASLGLVLELGLAQPSQIGRIAQLINKTNQFNLTTRRRTVEEVRALATSPEWRVYALNVADRFGAYGLVGVAVVEIVASRQALRLDTFLLSCRVLGRKVETSFLGALARDAAAAGVKFVEAQFIPTAKNALAAKFLPEAGFQQAGDAWRIAIDDLPSPPDFIEVSVNSGAIQVAEVA